MGDNRAGERAGEKPLFTPNSTLDTAQKRGRLRVGITPDLIGYSCTDQSGVRSGVEIDLIRAIARRLFGESASVDQYLEFVSTKLGDREDLLVNDEADIVIANFADTESRRKVIDFAGHYTFASAAPLVASHSPLVESAHDLNDQKVGLVRNSVGTELLPEIAPAANFVEFEYTSDALTALGSQEIDVFWADVCANKTFAKYVDPSFKSAPFRYGGERWAVGIKKNEDELSSFIDDAVADSVSSGLLGTSMRKWLS